jgi:hypothetical protein
MQFTLARLALRLRRYRAALALAVLASAVLTGSFASAFARSVDQTQAAQAYESTRDQIPLYVNKGLEQSVLKPRVPRPQVSTDDKKVGVDRCFDLALDVSYAEPLEGEDHVQVPRPVPHQWHSRAPPLHAV